MLNNLDAPGPSIHLFVSGEMAGTGATTVAQALAEKLRLPRISGGKFHRALAAAFARFSQEKYYLSEEAVYRLFVQQYSDTYETQGLAGVLELLATTLKIGADGIVVENFQRAIARDQVETGSSTPLWDRIVDACALQESAELEGFVWESKLAVILHFIDQLKEHYDAETDFSSFALPALRVLLTVAPTTAAQRVGQREHRPTVTVREILERQEADFIRFNQIYTFGGEPVTLAHLHEIADLSIDTTHLSVEIVTNTILQRYLALLNLWIKHNPALTHSAIELLSAQ